MTDGLPHSERAGRGLWLWWTLAYAASYFVGTLPAEPAYYFAFAGTTLGVLQWLVLRRYIFQAHGWMVATIGSLAAVGTALALGLDQLLLGGSMNALERNMSNAILHVLEKLALVTLTATMQWRLLRWEVSSAGSWIPASCLAQFFGIVGGAIGALPIFGFIGALTSIGFGIDQLPLFAVYSLVDGAITGGITGGVLVWLLRQPAPEVVSGRQ